MKKDIKVIKTAAKKYFDFYKKNFTKTQILKIELHPGFTVTGKYLLTSYGDVEFEEFDYKVTKEIKSLFELLCLDIQERLWDLELEDRVDVSAVDDFKVLAGQLNDAVFGPDDECEWSDYLDSDSILSDFYSVVEDFIVDEDTKAKSVTVDVSPNYSGVVTKGLDYVQVGCQRVTIENIKAILKAYEEINS